MLYLCFQENKKARTLELEASQYNKEGLTRDEKQSLKVIWNGIKDANARAQQARCRVNLLKEAEFLANVQVETFSETSHSINYSAISSESTDNSPTIMSVQLVQYSFTDIECSAAGSCPNSTDACSIPAAELANDAKTYPAPADERADEDAHNAAAATQLNASAVAKMSTTYTFGEFKTAEENKENLASYQASARDALFSMATVSSACRKIYEVVGKEAIQLIESVRDATAADERLEPEFSHLSSTRVSRLVTPGNQAADTQVVDLKMYNAFSRSQADADLFSIPEVCCDDANCDRVKVLSNFHIRSHDSQQPSTAESPAAATVCTGRHQPLLMNVGDLVITHSLVRPEIIWERCVCLLKGIAEGTYKTKHAEAARFYYTATHIHVHKHRHRHAHA